MGSCQTRKIDSLKQLLTASDRWDKTDLLYEIAYEYVDVNFDSGLRYASEAYDAAHQLGDTLRIIKAGRIKSLGFRRVGKFDSSLVLSLKILPIARRHALTYELKAILNGLGSVYFEQANYDKALQVFFESLEIRERYGDKFDIGIAYNNIGMVYYKLRDYNNALLYFEKSLRLRRKIDRKEGFESLLINTAIAHAFKNNFGESMDLVKQALSFCHRNCSDDVLMEAKYTLATIAFRQKNFSEAENQFRESFLLAKKIGNERFQLDNMVHLVQINLNNHNLLAAENDLKESEKLITTASTHFNREILEVYRQLFSLYSNSKDFEKVALYQNKYISLKDSIYNEELTTNLMKIEAEHLEKENKARIESQNKILALNGEVILRQKYLNIVIAIVALLLIAFAVILVRSNWQKQRLNQLLDIRVQERTKELVLKGDVLKRIVEEREILMHKTATDIKTLMATIKGLCLLGTKDTERATSYLSRVNSASDHFTEIVSRLSDKIQTPFQNNVV